MFLVDGRYLSSDQLFLERRKRGLIRFINLLVKHPILATEKLVSIFLTVDTELNVWRSGTSLELEEEFAHKVISQQFIKNWKEEQEMDRWRSIRLGTETSLETLTYVLQHNLFLFYGKKTNIFSFYLFYRQLCTLADRIAKRNFALAMDYKKVSAAVTSFKASIPLIYTNSSGDLAGISNGLDTVSRFLSNSSTFAQDESQATDIGFLEDLKLLRDTVGSTLELFQRFDRHNGDIKIQQLENRIQASEQKLKTLKSRTDVKSGSELDKIAKAIKADKRTINFLRNRSWLIREAITEEICLHERTQYIISRLVKDWAVDNLKYSELHSENWAAMNNEVADMPNIPE